MNEYFKEFLNMYVDILTVEKMYICGQTGIHDSKKKGKKATKQKQQYIYYSPIQQKEVIFSRSKKKKNLSSFDKMNKASTSFFIWKETKIFSSKKEKKKKWNKNAHDGKILYEWYGRMLIHYKCLLKLYERNHGTRCEN